MKTSATWDLNESQPEAWAQAVLDSIPESPAYSKKGHMGGSRHPEGTHTCPFGGFSKVVLILQSEASRRLSSFHISEPGDLWVLLNTQAWGLEFPGREDRWVLIASPQSALDKEAVSCLFLNSIYFDLLSAKDNLVKCRKYFFKIPLMENRLSTLQVSISN